jgi:serine/threonine protein kinase
MHMHELDPPLIHRDVKSPNILLTAALPDARARLADLGCTKVWRVTGHVLRLSAQRHAWRLQVYLAGAPMTCVGTPQWMAPEILRGERCVRARARAARGRACDALCRYGLAVDIYAFGVLMWEVASLKASDA